MAVINGINPRAPVGDAAINEVIKRFFSMLKTQSNGGVEK
jgi:hypothetical protein